MWAFAYCLLEVLLDRKTAGTVEPRYKEVAYSKTLLYQGNFAGPSSLYIFLNPNIMRTLIYKVMWWSQGPRYNEVPLDSIYDESTPVPRGCSKTVGESSQSQINFWLWINENYFKSTCWRRFNFAITYIPINKTPARVYKGLVFNGIKAVYLFCERPAWCLRVTSQHHGVGFLGVKVFLHQMGPEPSGCSQLGDLKVEVHPDAPEERETRGKLINVHTSLQACQTWTELSTWNERPLS